MSERRRPDRGPRPANRRPNPPGRSPRDARPRAPRGARAAAIEALAAFATDPATRIDRVLDTKGLEPRDAGLAFEIVHGVVRRQAFLDHVLTGFCARGLPPDPELLAALRSGAYQILYLARVPVHAAVDETVRLLADRARGFANAVLRRVGTAVREGAADPSSPRDQVALGPDRHVVLANPLPDPTSDLAGHLAVLGGLPRFLVARWLAAHGADRTRQLVDAAAATPGVQLRAVGRTPAELAVALATEGVETAAGSHPRLLVWTGGRSPFGTAAFRDGWFVVQDATAVRAAEAVGARAGERVLDLCAAPGTKATLLAEQVGPEGRVFAHDIDSRRRARIVDNVLRLGMPWIKIVEHLDRLEPVDRVLVDVPCSNTGVLARRVEVRHHVSETTIAELTVLQRELLAQALELVRPGGTVVYSTCSIEPEEGDGVVDAVVASRPDVEVVERVWTFPDPPHHDGGYHAILRRGLT